MAETVELLICTTCRSAAGIADEQAIPNPPAAPDAPAVIDAPLRDGARLALDCGAALPEGVRLREVECLSNCDHGCTAALRGKGRWTYIFGRLDPVLHAETLAEYAAAYRAAPAGLVPWRERPLHFRKNCIARIPPEDQT
ncbi:MAG: DUF1636 domain-containing protein [Paracoccus sp. (in: a-proteobacteria)]|nr:DUF1636 domain-containing protein [Paracoccus sp. (in: a-proteobacteria)]